MFNDDDNNSGPTPACEDSNMDTAKTEQAHEGWMERLGLERVRRLDQQTCMRRVHHLKRGLRHGWYAKDKLLEDHAKYYASWYAWVAAKRHSGDGNGQGHT